MISQLTWNAYRRLLNMLIWTNTTIAIKHELTQLLVMVVY